MEWADRGEGGHLATRLEEYLLAALLLIMVLLACGRILFRFIGSDGMLWADPLLRYLVLWSGLLGAVLATARSKHIAIDVMHFVLPARMRPWTRLVNQLFSALVCGCLSWAAVLFIRSEKEFGGPGLLEIPSWLWNLIFPLAFGLMSWRFFRQAVSSIRQMNDRGATEKMDGP